jgi:septal ring factor EnvC (AmiA/AmiB activator)
MFNGRRSSTDHELERKVETLSLKLLKANAALRTKTLYAERLEYLLHERNECIDTLNAKLDQLRAANKRLDQEAEHLARLVAVPVPSSETTSSQNQAPSAEIPH